MTGNSIFNKRSLEALDNNDHTLESARITRPSLLIVLCAMITMCIVVGYWCIFGTMNYKVTAQGVLFPHGEPTPMALPYGGTVERIVTAHGRQTRAGETLMEVRNDLATTDVKALNDGVVLTYKQEGEQFKPQEAIVWMMPQQSDRMNREMLVYAQFEDVRKLRIGQQAQVTPANMEREKWGYVYGKITSIERYPTTRGEVAKKLKMDALAAFLPADKAIYEVKVLLDAANTSSGLKWSRKKAEKIEIPTGTFCNVQVITSRKKVYEVLMGNVEDAVNNLIGD
ncbi:MAG: hypothetical protein ACI4B3_00735 [Prevotella sp.]